jgi:hypothetical protein
MASSEPAEGDRDVRIIRTHACTRTHRTLRTFAKCVWPKASQITGEGKWAAITHRADGAHISLHETSTAARDAKAAADCSGCGDHRRREAHLLRLAPGEGDR